MNSTLFGAWVRVKGELKKETYFITNDVLKTFPIIVPKTEEVEIIEKIYDFLIASEKGDRKENRRL